MVIFTAAGEHKFVQTARSTNAIGTATQLVFNTASKTGATTTSAIYAATDLVFNAASKTGATTTSAIYAATELVFNTASKSVVICGPRPTKFFITATTTTA